MSSLPKLVPIALCLLVASAAHAQSATARFGYGKPASAVEIAGWDIDVGPDGQGLPPGEGSVIQGERVYEAQCASCHGSFGEAVGAYPALAGGAGTLDDPRPQKTVGSFWRYTSTLWDYIHRAMPYTAPESLSDNEVYAVTAYVLYLNDLVDDDFVLSQATLATIRLPNEQGFVPDPRPDVANTRCMRACADPQEVRIASRAAALRPEPAAQPSITEAREAREAQETQETRETRETRETQADSESIALGREIAADRNRGNCFACHAAEGVEMAGNGGPPLVSMALRYPSRAALRAQIADPRTRNPDTVMPPYGAHGILTERELELVVDYIYSL